jgi:hypothetical protein
MEAGHTAGVTGVEIAGLRGLGQQASEEVVESLLGAGNVFAAVASCVVLDERVRMQDRFQASTRRLSGIGGGELVEMRGDVTFVPGGEDGLHVWEVFVERCASDAGLFRDRIAT